MAAGMAAVGFISEKPTDLQGGINIYGPCSLWRAWRARAQRHGQKSPAPLAEGESRRPIGAIVLIALGALFLLGNFGLLETEWVERSWPLLLIALGLYLFWKRSRGNA